MNRDSKGKFSPMEELTVTQLKAINMMVYEDMQMKEIAEQLKIGRTTLYDWLKDDKFNQAFLKEKAAYIKSLSGKAIKNLEKLMNSSDQRTALKANTEVLKQTKDFMTDILTDSTDKNITITLVSEDEE